MIAVAHGRCRCALYFEIVAALISLTVLQVSVPIAVYLCYWWEGNVVPVPAQSRERIPWESSRLSNWKRRALDFRFRKHI